MRASQFLIATIKETPSDAVVISHQLMLRAGMVRRLSSGLYTWLPMGLRVLRKVEAIVRDEMNRANAQELLMPVVQPAELWQESGRWQEYGPELCRINDRHNNAFCLGPTHEEVITDLIRNELKSYKQLPTSFYQIQTKFRDEVRPRFGVMRSREFIMKDAYSFHDSQESLQQTYDVMYDTYSRIFSRLGLDFRPVIADTGSIGGSGSHEFHVLADSGEDDIAFSDGSDFAANVEMAEALTPQCERATATQTLEKVATSGQHSIEEVSKGLSVEASQMAKTLIVLAELTPEDPEQGKPTPLMALIVRGDHELNSIKAEKFSGVASPLEFATDEQVKAATGSAPGSVGPIGLNIPMIIDRSAAHLADFVCGANEAGFHFTGANWGRDTDLANDNIRIEDIRNVVEGDPSPCGKGQLQIKRGIEVGHIFQLGTKYSEALNATMLNKEGREQVMTMGCYGIGITRVVASAIEQNYDDKGIIWPDSIAPFQITIIGMNMQKSETVTEQAEKLYSQLSEQGYDVILDDRNERPGVKFADMELMGIPHRIVIGDRGLKEGTLEYKGRRDTDNQNIAINDILDFVKSTIKKP